MIPRVFHVCRIDTTCVAQGLTSFAAGHQAESGEHAEERPDGVYGGWEWDGRELVAYTDPFGFYPLFYRVTNDGIAISPSMLELLSVGDEPSFDYDALAVFLRIGFFIGEETPFAGVHVLPPRGILRWDGELSVTGQPWWHPETSMSYDEAVDGLVALFRDAVRRRPPHSARYALPLSGGKDSRHILLELLHAGCSPPLCVTSRHYPPRVDTDAETAEQLVRRLGLEHQIVDPPPRFPAELERNIATNFCTDEHTWFTGVTEAVRSYGSTTYDGVGGDVLTDSSFFKLSQARDIGAGRSERVASALLEKFRSADDQLMFGSPRSAVASHAVAIEKVAGELDRFRDAVNPIGMFYFWNRTRREVSLMSTGMMRDLSHVYCPFIDQSLYRLLTSIPLEHLRHKTLHRDAIHRAHPEVADIPFAPYGPNRGAAWHYAKFTARLGTYLLQKQPRYCVSLLASVPKYLHGLVNHRARARMRSFSPAKLCYAAQLRTLQQGKLHESMSLLRPEPPTPQLRLPAPISHTGTHTRA